MFWRGKADLPRAVEELIARIIETPLDERRCEPIRCPEPGTMTLFVEPLEPLLWEGED